MSSPTVPLFAADSINFPRTRRGQARIAEILDVSLKLFLLESYDGMSMRKVADLTGISLSNLQHYFPTRQDLLEALLADVVASYEMDYQKVFASDNNPVRRLEKVFAYLTADVKKPKTERFFTNLWSLAIHNPRVRELNDLMYSFHRRNFEKLISDANPNLTPQQVAHRACLVAAQIEGLIVIIGSTKPRHKELLGVEKECVRSMLSYVLAP